MPAPYTDPTLGIEVDVDRTGDPPHRLVSIGDSLSHGFGSGAVFHTDLSFPAIIAHELGWSGLRFPTYPGEGGLPVNIEFLMRELEERFGKRIDWWEVPLALIHLRRTMDRIEDYWERGPGSHTPVIREPRHVLAVYGWDLRDALTRTGRAELASISPPSDDLIFQIPEDHGRRAALRVLSNTPDERRDWTVFDSAAALGDEGVETLVVFLGSNNALGSVTRLRYVPSEAPGFRDLEAKSGFTVWRPEHFAEELALVVARVRRVRARHVVWCTVPHVTIAPIARGVGDKRRGELYFDHYTRPWIDDDAFEPRRHRHLTGEQAAWIDVAIDAYNEAVVDAVGTARTEGLDWRICDTATVLDRLAVRRFLEDPTARPDWWTPYDLPAELARLDPVPDVRFLTADAAGARAAGGLFSLDGTHPTISGYGLLAQEVITVMDGAGVEFRHADGSPRDGPVRVDMARLIRRDTLLTDPPSVITSGLGVLSWADEAAGLFGAALPF